MEYMEHGNLHDYFIKPGTTSSPFIKKPANIPSELIILQIMTQMGEALRHIQKFKLVHRDVKPANILIRSIAKYDISICLSDFGLAKTFSGSSTSSSIIGTTSFLAPEVNQPYSISSDIFALGVTLFQLMTRDLSTHCSAVCKDQRYFKELFVKQQRANYSSHLIDFILRMMSLELKERPNIDQVVNYCAEMKKCKVGITGSYCSQHHDITKALGIYRNSNLTLIGVDCDVVRDFGHIFQFWFLPEVDRFISIAKSYLTNSEALIIWINCNSENSFNSGKDVFDLYSKHHSRKMIICFSGGFKLDENIIRKNLDLTDLDVLVITNWCRKPYEREYIKNISYSWILKNNSLFEDTRNNYNNRKKIESIMLIIPYSKTLEIITTTVKK